MLPSGFKDCIILGPALPCEQNGLCCVAKSPDPTGQKRAWEREPYQSTQNESPARRLPKQRNLPLPCIARTAHTPVPVWAFKERRLDV